MFIRMLLMVYFDGIIYIKSAYTDWWARKRKISDVTERDKFKKAKRLMQTHNEKKKERKNTNSRQKNNRLKIESQSVYNQMILTINAYVYWNMVNGVHLANGKYIHNRNENETNKIISSWMPLKSHNDRTNCEPKPIDGETEKEYNHCYQTISNIHI